MPTVTKDALITAMQVLTTAVVEALYPAEIVPSATVIDVDTSGTVDVTDAIQAYLDQAGELHLPAGRYLIDAEKSLRVRSNTELTMDPEAILMVKPNLSAKDYLLLVDEVENVKISGGQIEGDRATWVARPHTTDEWGFGVGVYGATNVVINDLIIRDCVGDGMSISRRSNNVTLNNVRSSGNRRQGLTIGQVDGVLVNGGEFIATEGTDPQAGIDIEPDVPDREAHNITIRGATLGSNAGAGLLIYKRVYDVLVEDCIINGNGTGVYTVEARNVEIRGCTVSGNGFKGLVLAGNTNGVKVNDNTFKGNAANRDPGLREAFTLAGTDKRTGRDIYVASASNVEIGTNRYE